jgi:hypothetical protein
MAIVVDSSQWTGESDDRPAQPHVWGEFPDRESRDRAVAQLLSAPQFAAGDAALEKDQDSPVANAGQVGPPDEEPLQADARNQRQLGVGIGASAAAMAAAGVVIATGGAALPAVAAAAAAGGATAAAGELVGRAAEPESSGNPGEAQPQVSPDGLVLAIRAETPEKRSTAEHILREAGAVRVWTQDPLAEAPARG